MNKQTAISVLQVQSLKLFYGWSFLNAWFLNNWKHPQVTGPKELVFFISFKFSHPLSSFLKVANFSGGENWWCTNHLGKAVQQRILCLADSCGMYVS